MARDRVVVGIDVGSSKVCTLIGTVPPEGKVNIIGSATVLSRGIKKGQVVDIEEAISSITASVEAAERMAGYSVSAAYALINGAHIECQNSRGVVAVADPEGEITPDDVRRVTEAARAVSLPSSREILHVLPRNFIVDSQDGIRDPIGMTGVRLEVETHIISGATTTMRNLAKCVSEIGVDVRGLVFGGLAAAEAAISETEKELGVVLVDLGGGTTDVCIFVDGALAHSAVIPVGAKNVTADLAIGLRVSLDSAEKIKLFLGEEPKEVAVAPDSPAKKEQEEKKDSDELNLTSLSLPEDLKTVSKKTLVEGIIRPRLKEIFSYVEAEIKKSGFGGLTPAGVVLSGGGAKTAGVVEVCKQTLAMPVRIGSPEGITGLIEEIASPDYTASVGLVLYGAKQEEVTFGFGIGKKFSFGRGQIQTLVEKAVNLLKSLLP